MNIYTLPYEAQSDWSGFLDMVYISQRGLMSVTFTNTNSVTSIAAGSTLEIHGDIFYFQFDEAIGNTGLLASGIPTYIRFVVSGDSVTAEYTHDVPSWDSLNFGWYRDGHRYYPGYWYAKPTLNVVASFQISGWDYFEDITTQGNEILVARDEDIRRYDTSGTLLGTISSPSGNIEAIASDGTDLHIITSTGWYKNGSLVRTLTYTADSATLVGQNMYILDGDSTNATIYSYQPDGTAINSVEINGSVGMGSVGTDLYVGDYSRPATVGIMPAGEVNVRSYQAIGTAAEYLFGLAQLDSGALVSLSGYSNNGYMTVSTFGTESTFSESFVPQILTLET